MGYFKEVLSRSGYFCSYGGRCCRDLHAGFAVPLKLWRFEDGVAYQLFDFAVNSGPTTALKQLQEAIGVNPDGVIGPITLQEIASKSESDLVMLVIAERLDYMASLRNWPAHGRGWVRRMAKNLRYAADDTD